jgi:hypothetical protein
VVTVYYRRYQRPYVTNLGSPYQNFINLTGNPSVKGMLVAASTVAERAFRVPTNPFDVIGVVVEDGVANGNQTKVVTAGLAEVLIAPDTTCGFAGWIRALSDNYGYAVNTTDPAGVSAIAAADHFKEIGHSFSKIASTDTNRLALVMVHPL